MIEQFPDDTYAIEGESLVLPVSVNGFPKPITTWLFEGVEVTNENCIEIQKDSSLYIPVVQLRHTGHYRLVAKNSLGNAERSFNVLVKLRELRRILTTHTGLVIKPVPLEQFGAYVAENHAQDNKGFRNQYSVHT